MGGIVNLVAESGKMLRELVGGGYGVGDDEVELVAEDAVEGEGFGVVDDIESGIGGEVGASEGEVAGELVGNHGGVAIAKNEVIEVANDHNTEEDGNGKNGGDAGVRVVGEEIVPFVEDVAQAVGDEDGEREEEQDGAFGIEASEEDSEDDQTAGDGVARGEETFGGGEEANDGKSDRAEADQWSEKDAFDGGIPREERQEGGAEVVPELAG